jgi:hypothetical protein
VWNFGQDFWGANWPAALGRWSKSSKMTAIIITATDSSASISDAKEVLRITVEITNRDTAALGGAAYLLRDLIEPFRTALSGSSTAGASTLAELLAPAYPPAVVGIRAPSPSTTPSVAVSPSSGGAAAAAADIKPRLFSRTGSIPGLMSLRQRTRYAPKGAAASQLSPKHAPGAPSGQSSSPAPSARAARTFIYGARHSQRKTGTGLKPVAERRQQFLESMDEWRKNPSASPRTAPIDGKGSDLLSAVSVLTAEEMWHPQHLGKKPARGRVAQKGVLPLVASVHAGDSAAVGYCLEHGAPVDSKTNSGECLLTTSAKRRDAEIVEMLLQAAADPNEAMRDGTGSTPLHAAAEGGSVECVELLLEWGSDTALRDRAGATPLILAVQALSIRSVQALIAAGADVNLACKDGRSPLLHAAQADAAAIIPLLCTAGADMRAVTEDGENAVVLAVEHNASHALRALLDEGADPEAEWDQVDETDGEHHLIKPIDLAREEQERTSNGGDGEIVGLLRDASGLLSPTTREKREKTRAISAQKQRERAITHKRKVAQGAAKRRAMSLLRFADRDKEIQAHQQLEARANANATAGDMGSGALNGSGSAAEAPIQTDNTSGVVVEAVRQPSMMKRQGKRGGGRSFFAWPPRRDSKAASPPMATSNLDQTTGLQRV